MGQNGDVDRKEERSVDRKIFSFGIAAIALLVVVICGGLVAALYGVSAQYSAEMQSNGECRQNVFDLRRALDRAEGRLDVYEGFLSDRRKDVMKKMINEYVAKTKINPADVTLDKFKEWMFGANGVMVGIGG